MFRTSGAARTAIGQGAGLILLIVPQQTPVEARISQADFRKLFAEKTVAVADARALTGGWVEWFNAGHPVEPGR